MSKLFIFDMGEVLILNVKTLPDIAREYNLDYDVLRSDYYLYNHALMEGWMTPDDYYRHMEINFALGKISDNPFLKYFKPTLNEFMIEEIRALKTSGHRVVVGSNTFAPHWDYILSTYPCFKEVFDSLYASHLIHIAKPLPAFWRHIISLEGAKAEDTIFIDDRLENIESAKRLGITTFQYLRNDNEIKEFFSHYKFEGFGK